MPQRPHHELRGVQLRERLTRLIFAAGLAALALTGCAADETETAPAPAADAQDATEDVAEPGSDVETDLGETLDDASLSDAVEEDASPEDVPPETSGLDISGMSVCEAYCATVDFACVGDDAIDFGEQSCASACASWEEGAEGDTAADTAGCRLFHATAALENPALHCPYASPDGGGICVEHGPSVCEQYCIAIITNCVGSLAYDFGDLGCEATCELWDEGAQGDSIGQTAHCHLSYAEEAADDPDGVCANASPGSLVCVEPEPDCAVDEDCPLGQTCAEGFCEGPILECLSDEDCEGDELCEEGACVVPPEPDCMVDGDCEAGEVCTDGSCVEFVPPPECVISSDCDTGEMCESGACVVVTYDEHVQPVLSLACGTCHTSQNLGNTNFGAVYEDNLASSYYCMGETVGACIMTRIDDGTMPPSGSNMSASSKSMIQIWLDGGMAE